MTDTAIRPCPFCRDSDPAIDEIDSGIWAVCCNDCKTIGPHQDGHQTPEEAIEKWNACAYVLARLQPYISRHGVAVAAPDVPLVRWHEEAMAIYRQAVNALSERHFTDAAQCEVRLSNHLMSIPVTIPPGYELVRKADSNALPAPDRVR